MFATKKKYGGNNEFLLVGVVTSQLDGVGRPSLLTTHQERAFFGIYWHFGIYCRALVGPNQKTAVLSKVFSQSY
jgi:hypothetical protein